MYHTGFIALAAACAIYFLKRRKTDPLTVAFGGSIIYFLPGLYGSIALSFAEPAPPYQETVVPLAYATMAIVLAVLTTTTFVLDRVPVASPVVLPFDRYIPPVLLVIILVSGAVSIYTVGPFYLCLNKAVMLAHIDRCTTRCLFFTSLLPDSLDMPTMVDPGCVSPVSPGRSRYRLSDRGGDRVSWHRHGAWLVAFSRQAESFGVHCHRRFRRRNALYGESSGLQHEVRRRFTL